MSSLEKLGSSLVEAIRKVLKSPIIDEATVKELIKDFQRALLKADVNVNLVFSLSKKIEERTLNEKLPPGISRREHILKVVYEELTAFLGEKPARLGIKTGEINVLMLVGIQGSGKTTSSAKMARYFQKRGYKSALICTDTYRPGAYAQLKQLATKTNISVFGREKGENAIDLAVQGVNRFRKEDYDIIIIDTAGRHKNEEDLIKEMKSIVQAIKPDEILLVIDATIGQQAATQAKAFNEATDIGSILVTKLDGTARAGGALSAVAFTGAPIKYIGTGETLDDIELFVPSRFVGRLLGMGDLEGLVQKVREAEVKVPKKKAVAMLRGDFTLTDMYSQIEAVKNMGPMRHFLKMLPGMGHNLPEDVIDVAEERMERWRYIIQSMTNEERENPKILNSSRIRRIARGSGTNEKDIKELRNQYFQMKKLLKSMRGRRLPPFLRNLRGIG
jgi:signal recognition particle subunit SRP54